MKRFILKIPKIYNKMKAEKVNFDFSSLNDAMTDMK